MNVYFTCIQRILTSLIAILSFVVASAQGKVLYQTSAPAGFASAKIPKCMLEKDMQIWTAVMEESHVNIYHFVTKPDLLQLQKELLAQLPDSVSHFQASFAISRLVGTLNEGHLGFVTNKVSDSLYLYQAVRFPFFLQDIDEGSFIVQRDLTRNSTLPAFSRIIEVNGIPVQQLYAKYEKFYGGLPAWKKLLVKNNIRKLLYMDSVQSPFTIKAIIDTDTIQFKAEGYTFDQADSISKLLSAEYQSSAPFSLQFLDHQIALIEFNTMDGKLRDSFSLFLRRSFEEIKRRNAAGVIIDLRKNGGGDSGLGDSLISYFSSKSYRNISGMKMKISEHSKEYNKLAGYKDPFKNWKNGKLYEYKVDQLTRPADQAFRFQGKTAVLIGTGTFSSANMLTNAIKDYHLATLIGESTAEPGNDFGEIVSFMLPNTRIIATTALKMFTRANGDEQDFNGIAPDIEVKSSREDIIQKKDRVLARAVEWINENK
jgi:hypothetical protein